PALRILQRQSEAAFLSLAPNVHVAFRRPLHDFDKFSSQSLACATARPVVRVACDPKHGQPVLPSQWQEKPRATFGIPMPAPGKPDSAWALRAPERTMAAIDTRIGRG